MRCPYCNEENREDAAFCKQCGKSLKGEQAAQCPNCHKALSHDARFCPNCGTAVNASPAVPQPRRMREKPLKALDLAGGISMLAAAFCALIFAFFIGTKHRVTGNYSYSESLDVWHYFGRAYSLLESSSAGMGYSNYTLTAHYLPVVLSTIIGAGTMASTVAFAMVATVKFGLHFKRSNEQYYKYAVAAVFSFILGATLFDCIHSVSSQHQYASLNATTVWGLSMCCLFIIASLSLKTAALGSGGQRKQKLMNCACTLVAILFLAMVSGFGISEQTKYTVMDYGQSDYSINFYYLNATLSFLYDAQSSIPGDYIASFVFALFAVLTQIALQVLAFILLIRHIGNYNEEKPFSLGLAIALVAVAAAYLTFSAVAVEMINGLSATQPTGYPKLWITAAPIMTLVDSLLYLAIAITYKAITKKEGQEEAHI